MIEENSAEINNLIASIQKLIRTAYVYPLKKSKACDLTLSQNKVVKILAASGSLSSAELSRKLFVTPSNITGIIARLEKKNLVERIRKKNDRRIYLINLTEQGKKIEGLLTDPYEQKIGANLKKIKPERVDELAGAVRQIINLIDEE
jgi:DNA-binding MarR family transcriptional regulator